MAALLLVKKVEIHDEFSDVSISPKSEMMILADVRSYNPEILRGNHEYIYNVQMKKSDIVEYNVQIPQQLADKMDEIEDAQPLHVELPRVEVEYKDGKIKDFFFFNDAQAQNFIDTLEKELEDFFKNYGSYVAVVQKD